MSRILVVEDEERISSFLEKGLRANGFTPTVVADGDEALSILRHETFELVILDLGLPGSDGTAVLEEPAPQDRRAADRDRPWDGVSAGGDPAISRGVSG